MARSLRCPRCSTVVTVADGQTPICPACGFGGPASPIPAAPSPPPPAMGAPFTSSAPAFSAPPASLGSPQLSALPPQPRTRPGSVTLVAVLGFIGAGFAALLGVLLLLGGSFFGALFAEYAESEGADVGGAFAIFFAVIGVIVLLVAALEFFIALGILRGRNWARITQLVLSFIGIAGGLGTLLFGNFTAILGLALNVAIVVILLSRDAKAYFEQPRPLA